MGIEGKSPNPTDVFVGSRIRTRRNMIGMSQERLADSLGITFQQVQKYEKGTNRVGASRLQAIATALNVPVMFFFQQEQGAGDLAGIGTPNEEHSLADFLSTKEGVVFNRAFLKIKDAKVRKSVVAMTKAIAEASLATQGSDVELEADSGVHPAIN